MLCCGWGLTSACSPTFPFVRNQDPPAASPGQVGAVAQVEFPEAQALPPVSQPPSPAPPNTTVALSQAVSEPAAPGPELAQASLFQGARETQASFLDRPQFPSSDPVSEATTKETTTRPASNQSSGGKEATSTPQRCTDKPARPLARAINAFLENRPEEAVNHLREYAPKDQELVMQLLPILAEVDRDGVLTQQPRPDRVQAVLASVRNLEADLRPHAPLVMEKLNFCQDHPEAIEAFGVVKKRASNKYRAGDYPYIYAELQNLVDQRGSNGRYVVRLASVLEIRAVDGRAVHRYPAIQNEPLASWSPRTDFFTRIGFQLPANLAPGLYSLRVRVTDLETGRTVEQGLPFQVVPGPTR